jgi:DNA-binding NarL/FixJ family response regulator
VIRVFIADDHPVFRSGLRKVLEDTGQVTVVGEADDGRQVLLAPNKHRWDILVLDVSLPRVSGIEVLRRLREEMPSLKVLVVSMFPEEQYAARMIAEGALGYVSKARPPEEMVAAIERVAAGGRWVRAESVPPKGEVAAPHTQLTAREHQVFTLICQGLSVTDIAVELDLRVIDQRPHRREFVVGGHVRLLLEEAPQLHQRAHRDVEGASAGPAHVLGGGQYAEHRRTHRHRVQRRLAVHAADLAVGPVVAHQPVHFGDRREGFLDHVGARRRIDARHLDGHRGAHEEAVHARDERCRLCVRAGDGGTDRRGQGDRRHADARRPGGGHGRFSGMRRPVETVTASKPLSAL